MKDSTNNIVMKPLSELRAYQFNARLHDGAQIDALKRSIKEFGFTNPVLINSSGRIIAGHGRMKAADELGMSELPCLVLDLSEAQSRAYTIADNQLPQMASWDFDMLAVEIDELKDLGFDISTLGFNAEELTEMLGSPNEMPEISEEEDEKAEKDTTICPKCHHEFVL
jgi:ParB-like chromosome segregation protein Spo0J